MTSLDTKLLALGAPGRSRLSKQWLDADLTNEQIASSFGFHRADIQRLKSLLGPRPLPERTKHGAPRGLGRLA